MSSANDEDESDHRARGGDLRSFGRRRGRKASERQRALLEDLLPQIAVEPARLPWDLKRGLFAGVRDLLAGVDVPPPAGWTLYPAGQSVPAARRPGRDGASGPDEVWLEIGFGGGEHLIAQARANPHVGIIGAEPFEDGVVKVLAAIDEERRAGGKALANIRLIADDVRPLLRALPPACLARVFILFPDPWPKRRHAKRRLIQPSLLGELARVMQPGGELRIATDIEDYLRTALLALNGSRDFRWCADSPSGWRSRTDDWPETRYERKALREGRRCYYLRFKHC